MGDIEHFKKPKLSKVIDNSPLELFVVNMVVLGQGDLVLSNVYWNDLDYANKDSLLENLENASLPHGYLGHFRDYVNQTKEYRRLLTIRLGDGSCTLIKMSDIVRIDVKVERYLSKK